MSVHGRPSSPCVGLGGILHFNWFLQGFFSCPSVYLDLILSFTRRSPRKTLIPETKRKHTGPLDLVRCPGGLTELKVSFSICMLEIPESECWQCLQALLPIATFHLIRPPLQNWHLPASLGHMNRQT